MEQTAKLLEQLAMKLGTTAEYLWSILVKQAFLAGIQNTLLALLGVVLGFYAWRLHSYFDEEDSYDEGFPAFLVICLGATSVGLFLAGLYFASNAFFNPEYWALREILDAVGGK